MGEASHLTPAQIDKNRLVIRVIGKGNKERLVPLSVSLLEGLRQAWTTHRNPDWVFANQPQGNPICRRMLYSVFHRARQEAGLPPCTPHALRHSYATRLLEQDVKVEIVQILLGHASVRTTQTYLHLTEPTRDRIQSVIGDLMRDLC